MPPKRLHELNRRPAPGSLPDLPRCCRDGELFCEAAWGGITERLGLSPRQAETVRCVLADQSDDDIASALSMERATVRTHMERLHGKLGTRNRVQLAVRVFRVYRAWYIESSPPLGCPLRNRLV